MAVLLVAQAALIAALLAQQRVRRRAEFELRESEQRMSLVAAATGLGMWVQDIPRRTFWANPQQCALLGIDASAPYDLERFLHAVHADDRGPVREAIARAMESGGEYDVRYRVPLANGAMRWVAARGRGEVDARGRPVRMRASRPTSPPEWRPGSRRGDMKASLHIFPGSRCSDSSPAPSRTS